MVHRGAGVSACHVLTGRRRPGASSSVRRRGSAPSGSHSSPYNRPSPSGMTPAVPSCWRSRSNARIRPAGASRSDTKNRTRQRWPSGWAKKGVASAVTATAPSAPGRRNASAPAAANSARNCRRATDNGKRTTDNAALPVLAERQRDDPGGGAPGHGWARAVQLAPDLGQADEPFDGRRPGGAGDPAEVAPVLRDRGLGPELRRERE